jgi:hypothetical protein
MAAPPYAGSARQVATLQVEGAQNSRSFSDGVTTLGSTTLTSATANFSATDVNKVVTGPGIPANTYLVTGSNTSFTMSNAATATGSGLTIVIAGTLKASVAYTAWFGAGTVQANGQVAINGWRDEVPLMVTGMNNQASNLAEWWLNGIRVARVTKDGSYVCGGSVATFEGNPNSSTLGIHPNLSKPALLFGAFPYDVALTHDASGIVGVAGGLRLGTGFATTVAGSRLWSGSGAPSITASAAGDFYFRTDTPTTANQRLYIATAVNTWTGIL